MEIDTKTKKAGWHEETVTQHLKNMGIIPIAKINNHFSTKNMRTKNDLDQEMKEGKNILPGTVAWDAENCWMVVWTAYGWIKFIGNETVEQSNERAQREYIDKHLSTLGDPSEKNPRRYPTFKSQLEPEELEKFQVFEDGIKI